MGRCHYCGFALSPQVQQKNHLCPGCGSDLHCCKNCSHYDEASSMKCRESNSPWISDRSRQNQCPYFEFQVSSPATAPTENSFSTDSERAKEAFRALFKSL